MYSRFTETKDIFYWKENKNDFKTSKFHEVPKEFLTRNILKMIYNYFF